MGRIINPIPSNTINNRCPAPPVDCCVDAFGQPRVHTSEVGPKNISDSDMEVHDWKEEKVEKEAISTHPPTIAAIPVSDRRIGAGIECLTVVAIDTVAK